MLNRVFGLTAFILLASTWLSAAAVKGRVVDPSGAAIGGAQIALTNRVGVLARTASGPGGAFVIDAPNSPDAAADAMLVVTAAGFAMRSVALGTLSLGTSSLNQAATITLELAPRVD